MFCLLTVTVRTARMGALVQWNFYTGGFTRSAPFTNKSLRTYVTNITSKKLCKCTFINFKIPIYCKKVDLGQIYFLFINNLKCISLLRNVMFSYKTAKYTWRCQQQNEETTVQQYFHNETSRLVLVYTVTRWWGNTVRVSQHCDVTHRIRMKFNDDDE